VFSIIWDISVVEYTMASSHHAKVMLLCGHHELQYGGEISCTVQHLLKYRTQPYAIIVQSTAITRWLISEWYSTIIGYGLIYGK